MNKTPLYRQTDLKSWQFRTATSDNSILRQDNHQDKYEDKHHNTCNWTPVWSQQGHPPEDEFLQATIPKSKLVHRSQHMPQWLCRRRCGILTNVDLPEKSSRKNRHETQDNDHSVMGHKLETGCYVMAPGPYELEPKWHDDEAYLTGIINRPVKCLCLNMVDLTLSGLLSSGIGFLFFGLISAQRGCGICRCWCCSASHAWLPSCDLKRFGSIHEGLNLLLGNPYKGYCYSWENWNDWIISSATHSYSMV